MAARHPPVGIAHPTVVPENFDPDRPEREGEGGDEGRPAKTPEYCRDP